MSYLYYAMRGDFEPREKRCTGGAIRRRKIFNDIHNDTEKEGGAAMSSVKEMRRFYDAIVEKGGKCRYLREGGVRLFAPLLREEDNRK